MEGAPFKSSRAWQPATMPLYRAFLFQCLHTCTNSQVLQEIFLIGMLGDSWMRLLVADPQIDKVRDVERGKGWHGLLHASYAVQGLGNVTRCAASNTGHIALLSREGAMTDDANLNWCFLRIDHARLDFDNNMVKEAAFGLLLVLVPAKMEQGRWGEPEMVRCMPAMQWRALAASCRDMSSAAWCRAGPLAGLLSWSSSSWKMAAVQPGASAAPSCTTCNTRDGSTQVTPLLAGTGECYHSIMWGQAHSAVSRQSHQQHVCTTGVYPLT